MTSKPSNCLPGPMSTRAATHAALRVAILDDDADVVAAIGEVLRRQGLAVQEFTDPAELSLAIRERVFDAYVLDWLLGDVTALDIVVQLRADAANEAVPIFLLSGNLALGGVPTDPVLAAAIAEHRLFYRAKPFSTRQLARDICMAYEGGSP
ncbi:response regulator [Xenophilus azovorans]|nr:response regulator [Xenophilus azovorans]